MPLLFYCKIKNRVLQGKVYLLIQIKYPPPSSGSSMPVFLSRLSGFPLPAVLRGPLICKVPVRARFRSDKYAAVLRLQSTQPKDRRFYTALTGILAVPQPVRRGRSQQCPQTNSQNRTPQGIRGQVPNVSIKLPVVNGVFGEGNYIVYLEGGSVV